MNYFNTYFVDVLKNQYADVNGRAVRSQFWYFVLFSFIVSFVLGIVDSVLFGRPILSLIFNLVVLFPSIAIAVRRLHDLGKTGWWYLLIFVPFVGQIVLIVWFCMKGQTTKNQYGDAILK